MAVLVAESFEDLMITTCSLRNEDSEIDGYLIQAQANAHKELSFHHIVRPAIDIQVEKIAGTEYSKFWEPIRQEGLFAGKPVLVRDEGWIGKGIHGLQIELRLRDHHCYIQLPFWGENRLERRDEIMKLFPESEYDYEYKESPKSASVIFPVLDKGKKDRDDWPEIRKNLVSMGTDIYNKINESDT